MARLAGMDPDAARFGDGRIEAAGQSRTLIDLVGAGGVDADGEIRPGATSTEFSQQSYGAHFAEVARDIARYYVLSIEPTLFAKHTLIRRWGRIGSSGRERLQFFAGEDALQAQVTLDTWLARKRNRGYAPRSGPVRPALFKT